MKMTQKGASLLEVMVALLIMALGLLGMAGLQAATSKFKVNTQAQTAVAQLVSEISEKIRVNPEAAGSSYDPTAAAQDSKYLLESDWKTQLEETISIDLNCETNACTSDERAEFDMGTWRLRVRDTLPRGNALLQGSRRDGFDVTLMWMDKEQTSDEENEETGEKDRVLKKAPVCQDGSEHTIVHNCCPAEADAPEGVKCLRMSFLP